MATKVPIDRMTTQELYDKKARLTYFIRAVSEEIEKRELGHAKNPCPKTRVSSPRDTTDNHEKKPSPKKSTVKKTEASPLKSDREKEWKMAAMKKVLNEKGVETPSRLKKDDLIALIYKHRCVGKM